MRAAAVVHVARLPALADIRGFGSCFVRVAAGRCCSWLEIWRAGQRQSEADEPDCDGLKERLGAARVRDPPDFLSTVSSSRNLDGETVP
jgi:hypothetical protein